MSYAPGIAEARLRIRCEVSVQGAAENCTVLSQEPANYDFHPLVVALQPILPFSPGTEDGRPVRSVIIFPLHLQTVLERCNRNDRRCRRRAE